MSANIISTIGKGTIVTSVGTMMIKIVGIGSTFLTLHQLTVYEYGLTELAISVIPLLSIFLLPGLANVVIAEMGIAKGEGNMAKAKALFNDFFRHQAVLAVFGWAIIFFGAIISGLYNENIADLFRIASFSFLLGPLRTNFQAALRVDLRFTDLSFYGIVEELVKVSVLAYCFLVLDLGMISVLYAYVLNEVITLTLFFPVFLRVYRGWGEPDTTVHSPFRLLFAQHGKWMLMTSYLNNFSNNIRLWIIKVILGTEAVGLFSLAMSLYAHTVALFPLGTILSPIFPQYINQREKLYRLVAKGIKYQFLVFSAIAIVAAIVFPTLLGWLFPKFSDAMSLYVMMLIVLLPHSFGTIFSPLFGALRAQKSLFYSTLVKTVSILVLLPACLFLWKIPGIAVEFFLTMAFLTFERYRALRRILTDFILKPRDFFVADKEDSVIMGQLLKGARQILR